MGAIQKRDERFISAFSGQSTPGVAAGVTGAEQRLVGGTHDPIVCAANKSAGLCRSSFSNARGACLPFGNIAKIRPLLDLGPLGMLIWCGLCSRHSSDRATWYVHRTGRGAKVAFISE